MWRAALFALTGGVSCAYWLLFAGGANFQDPTTPVDWLAILSFSASLFALAAALPALATLSGGRLTFRIALVAGGAAAAAGVINMVEDGLSIDWAFLPFIASAAVLLAALIALTIAIAAAGRGRNRLLAIVPVAVLLTIGIVHGVGGAALILGVWLAAAALALADRGHYGAHGAPLATKD